MDFSKACGYKNNIHNNINSKIQENVPDTGTGFLMMNSIHTYLMEKQRT